MGLTGNLKTISFPDVLQLLSTGKKTGVLSLVSGTRKKEVCFKDGNISHASSVNSSEDLLGNLLLKRGKKCAGCGTKVPKGAVVCPNCGAPVGGGPQQPMQPQIGTGAMQPPTG